MSDTRSTLLQKTFFHHIMVAVSVSDKKVLIVTEVSSELCVSLCSSLVAQGCQTALTGLAAYDDIIPKLKGCKFIPSDLATSPGREALAMAEFEKFDCLILVDEEVVFTGTNSDSVMSPDGSTSASVSDDGIKALASANRNRHLSELFQKATSPGCLIYIKPMAGIGLKGDPVLVARPIGNEKQIVETFVCEKSINESVWTDIWKRMATGDYTPVDWDEKGLVSPGDSLSRSSAKKKEKHPWTIQDCSFFP
eukprot:Blabericola_migrator_1__2615@NODE_173_length_12074_cov_75_040476_g150_i0_p7_GENE_NODE_173_length_12074_cov_75_040476_g150_i0NODE_173_length_12074_cov_75_040476_g150_i0_p7_ORF_typecomplete_len251_score56_52DUF499/PF04465_12/9_8e02DUF499/PF04465_12/0_45_NODE_173_length_12074_cov_75_040476_g150_i090339785